MPNDPWVELVCPNGHRTRHGRAAVLSRNNAWCPRCGVSIILDAQQLADLAASGTPDGDADGATDEPASKLRSVKGR